MHRSACNMRISGNGTSTNSLQSLVTCLCTIFLSEIYKQFRLFEIAPEEEGALAKLLEVMKIFEETGQNNLKDFLVFADDETEDAEWNIALPHGADAVSVMTIHKAKGLDNRVVIVLLVDSKSRSDNLFVDENADGVRLVHITKVNAKYDKSLQELYDKNRLERTVDDLNKLYVAFTRAKEEMYVISVKTENAVEPSKFLPSSGYESSEKPDVVKQKQSIEPVVHMYHSSVRVPISSIASEKLALYERRRGDAIHDVLSQVEFSDANIEKLIASSINETAGSWIQPADEARMKSTILEFLRLPEIAPFFAHVKGRVIMNEQEFVSPDGRLYRMDRIVVDADSVTVLDFKTGDDKDTYTDQVRGYVNILNNFFNGVTSENFDSSTESHPNLSLKGEDERGGSKYAQQFSAAGSVHHSWYISFCGPKKNTGDCMSGRIVLSPTEHLVETVASHLESHGRDYSKTAIVFPGKRPAHFLRKELTSRTGGSIIPPKIFSVDEFVLSLYQQFQPEPVHDLEPIDAAALLHLVHSELKERLGGDYFISLDAFIPVGLKLFGELEELRLANLPERKLKEILSALTYNRLFSLADYFTKFYALTAEKGFTTRAVRYAEVAGHIGELDLSGYKQIVVAGLFKLTHAEQIIFNDLEKRPNTLFVFQTDKIEEGTPEPEIRFYKASDTHGQVFALSALIKKQLDDNGQLDERSVIVLPTADALFPVVNQTLSLMPQEQYNIALEYPMARTPIYGFLHSLMELVCTKQGKRYSAAHYIKFILHPYTKNIRLNQRTDVTRILFHAIESLLTKDKSKILMTLEEIEQSDEIFTNVAMAISETDK